MKTKQALETIGGLSNPAKMPCKGYSIPAVHCQTGSKLRQVVGSTCNKCYALKGMYRFSTVENALENRFQILLKALNNKEEQNKFELAFRVLLKKQTFFRWHDAGDIQSVKHLELICRIAEQNPHVMFWIPTREYKIVSDYLAKNEKPENLNIRLSAHKIDTKGPQKLAEKLGLTVSEVHSENTDSFSCPSKYITSNKTTKSGKLDTGFCSGIDTRTNKKTDCRKCWNNNHKSTSYPIH